MRLNTIIKPLLFVLLFCITTNLFSQSEDQNYVLTRVMQDENGAHFIDKIAYFDGLGRPVQTVMKGTSPLGKDIVTLQEYDQAGRAWRNWQPAPTGESGAYVHTDVFQSTASGFYADNHPYSETLYEPTPLNRVKEQYGPGKNWYDNGKRVINNWFTNNASDKKCLSYQVASSGGLVCNGIYPDAQLYVSEVIDEDGNKSYTFTDKRERVVLTRQIDMGQNYDTYYVYDDIEHLRYVLPPLAADALTVNNITWNMTTNEVLNQYAYYYQYDERGNCILKKIPGREAIWMVYDKAERLVLSQDGNQRSKNGWTVNKYDPLGRLAYTAEIIDPTAWETLLNYFKELLVVETFSAQPQTNPMGDTGYSRNFYHNASTQLLTVNYYNDYAFLDLLTPETKAALAYNPMPEYDSPHPRATGMLTGTRVYSLHTGQYTAEAIYYDQRANVVQSRATNHLGGYDIAYHQYNFVGNIGKSLKVHSAKSQPTTTLCYTYQYDNAARLTHTYYKLNNDAPLLLVKNEYDEIGRLHRKKRHNEVDTEQFDYNVRGWTTRIQSGAFEENIYYTHTGDYSQAAPRYNGNISAVSWTEKNNINAYAYTYDALNRLTRSECYLGGVLQNSGKMEESFTYDKHGNITCLKRGARDGVIDHLQIKYQGNRVESITDWAISTNLYLLKEYRENSRSKAKFRYDGNGNTTSDLDRQIVTIRYNLLNLPDMIQFKNGSQIVNRYDALGRKLETRFVTFVGDISVPVGEVSSWLHGVAILLKENVTQYCGDYEYTYSQANNIMEKPSLSKIHNTEGYKDGRDLKSDVLHYYRRDHLGNVREVWRHPFDPSMEKDPTKQRTQYYPSGLPWAGGIGADYQNRKYNGKEFVEMHGYDTYDYGARGMYPAIMRFTSIDPLAEKYYSVSPYAYCGNNPIRFIDPTGMSYEEPEKDKKPSFFNQLYQAFNTLVGFLAHDMGVHPAQLQSKDPAVREDASLKREKTINTLNAVNETLLSPIPGGEIGYKLATDQKISKETIAWEAVGVIPIGKVSKVSTQAGFKTLIELGLKDGMKVSSSRALELGEKFLGKGYKELVPGSGRYVSSDGMRVFRMGKSDITGVHGAGPHVNFETLVPNPSKPGKMVVDRNYHIYLTD